MRSLICVIALAAAACTSSYRYGSKPAPPPTPSTQAPLPLDPLSDAEAARAQDVAQADAATSQLLGVNPRLIYVLSIAPKMSADGEPHGRHADVLYRREDNTFGVRVLVDLAATRVVDRVRVAIGSVPIGTADVDEALEIAQSSGELEQLLGSYARGGPFRVLNGPLTRERANENFVQGIQHTGSGPDDPCRTNRCVYLVFNSEGRQVLRQQQVLVDLNTRRVMVTRTGAAQ